MRRLILIHPPLHFSNGVPFTLDGSVPPIGLLSLASYINGHSKAIRAEVIDLAVSPLSLTEISQKISADKPFAVGIYAMTPQLQGALELARCIKAIHRAPPIFLGGPHISADLTFVDRHPDEFDYAIAGEAEATFLESLHALSDGGQLPRVQHSVVVKDLDTIPPTDRTLVPRGRYIRYESMLFSRGCPYKCYYCSRPSIDKSVRYRSVGHLIAELREVRRENGGLINFQDDTFTMRRKKVLELCDALIRERLRLRWRCNTRIDLVDPELLRQMSRAGCEQINFGIEAGNERLRREVVHKGYFTNETIYEVFAACRKERITVACYFMLGHPTETEAEIEDTKRMILSGGIGIMGLSLPLPFPASPLYDIAEREGQINLEMIDAFAEKEFGEGYSGNYPVYVTPTLSKEYLFHQLHSINRAFYLRPSFIFRRAAEDLFNPGQLFSDTKDFLALISRGVSHRKPYRKKAGGGGDPAREPVALKGAGETTGRELAGG
ncbi:MAG: radical SAM protein [Verrucomicrobiae bacterium]|nr:radical SAM protein [Verrucomicrobiae bacterium]